MNRLVSRPAALACRLSEVGLLSVAMLEEPVTPCLACCVAGVPGQDSEESRKPAVAGERWEEEVEKDEGTTVISTPSFRGCSWRMES